MAKRTTESDVAIKPPEPRTAAAPGAVRPATGRLVWICIGAWLVPGLGHFILGRKWRALILGASILAMFLLGLAMKGEFFATQSGSYLETLGYLGQLCVGAPMLVAKFFNYAGDSLFVSSDYGTAFLVSAGMLNVLCILDAFDIAMGRKP
ncbi:MAG TPA: DUF6677 family protein [Terriglobia bacterium]|nr:DUF6677 family protein [Terriglobia bacterium]